MKYLFFLLTPLLIFAIKPKEQIPIYNQPFCFKKPTIDLYATTSLLYWKASQDNVSLGFATVSGQDYSLNSGTGNSSFQGTKVPFHCNYKPGFKIGIGGAWKRNDVDIYLEYTRFRSEYMAHFIGGGPVFLFPSQVVAKTVEIIRGNFFKAGSGKWLLGTDLLSLEYGKLVYQSPSLLFHAFVALRNAWLRESLYFDYAASDRSALRDEVKNTSHSWGIGPQIGVKFHWKIWKILSLSFKSSLDLLHTHYSVLKQTTLSIGSDITTATSGNTNSLSSSFLQNNISSLRSHFDSSLELSIAKYFANNQYRWNLSLGYDLQIFFSQNMFRHFSDSVSLATSNNPNGDLYLEGINASFRLDY